MGDVIEFEMEDGARRSIQVAAIVKYTAELMGPSSWSMAKYHPWTVAVPLDVVQDWFQLPDQIESIQIKALPGVNMAVVQQQLDELAKQEKNIYMQSVILDFNSQFKDADTFFIALYIAGFLGIALSAFVIFNSQYVSIEERKKEFAALKTIGYTPQQLRRMVLSEVILMAAVGTAAGLAIGYGLALLLKAAIFLIFSVHEEESLLLTKSILVSVLAGVLVPIAASLYPIQQAGKVSVIAVLKETKSEKTKMNRWVVLSGALLIASSFFIKSLFVILPLLLGIALIYSVLLKVFVILLEPGYRLLFGFAGETAIRNLRRNPGRTSMTSVILCLGIAMLVLMSSLNSAIVQSYEKAIYATYGGNLDVMFHHAEPGDLEKLRQTEGVADTETYSLQSAGWHLDGLQRKLPVYGVGAEWIDRFPLFTSGESKQSELIGNLKADELAMDSVAFEVWGGAVGEQISLDTPQGTKAFTVVAVVETIKNSGFGAFMNEDHFKKSFGTKFERNALVLRDERVSPLQLRENVFDTFGVRIEKMFGPEDLASVVGGTLTGSFSVINFLIVLSVIISGIGITNTLMINIMERVREIGMLRAIGVTRRQIIRTIALEGFGIGLVAVIIGCGFGILLIYITSTFLEIQSLTYGFGVPWAILAIIGVFGILVSFIASVAPASKAAKTPLSEALRYE